MGRQKVFLKFNPILIAILAITPAILASSRGSQAQDRDGDRDDDRRSRSFERRLVFLAEPSSRGVAGESLSTNPWLASVNREGYPDFRPLHDLEIAAYLDPSCTVPATNGKFSAGYYSFYSRFGLALFYGVSETSAGGVYLKVSARDHRAACSSEVKVSPAAADHLIGVSGDLQTGATGTVLGAAAQVKVVDPFGNAVSGVSLTFSATSGGGSVSPSVVTSDSNGLASSSLKLGSVAGTDSYVVGRTSIKLRGSPPTITFTETATSVGSTAPVSLALAGPATQTAGACSSAFTVSLLSRAGQPANTSTAIAVSLSNLASGAIFSDAACSKALPSVSIAAGTSSVTFYVKDTRAESLALQAAANGLSSSNTVTDWVVAGPATALGYSTLPSDSAVAGQALAIQPALKALDAYGNAAAGAFTISLAAAKDATCQTAMTTGILSVAANPVATVSGVATFAAVSETQAGTLYLLASANGLSPACSRAITINAAAPSSIAIAGGDKQSVSVGSLLSVAPQVKVVDAYGNAVSGAGLAFSVTRGGGSVSPVAATSDANGFASTSMTVGTGVGSNTLVASSSSSGVAWAQSQTPAQAIFSETAVAGAVSKIALSGPATAVAGDCSAYSITLSDSQGNSASAAAPLSVALSGQSHGAFYSDPSCSQSESAGVVASGANAQVFYFSDTVSENVGLNADGTALGLNTVSVSISVGPAAASKLAFSAQPFGSASAGAAFATQPTIVAQDRFGNLAPAASAAVTLAAYTDAACLSPAGGIFNVSANPVGLSGGQAMFAGSSYNLVGVLYLGASAPGLGSTCSTASAITAGAPDHLISLSGSNQSAAVGQSVPGTLQVKVVDVYGNPANGAAIAFTVTGGGGSVGSPSATSDGNGLAFSSFTLGTLPGANTVQASGSGSALPGSPAAITFNETAVAGSPAAIVLSGAPTAQAGSCSTAFTLIFKDSYGNPTPASSAMTISLSGAGSGGFFVDAACTTSMTAASINAGAASGSFYFKDTKSENLLLAANGGVGVSGSILPLTIQAAAGSVLAIASQPSSTGIAGQALSSQPQFSIRDAYGNLASASQSSVTLAAYTDVGCTAPAVGALGVAGNPVNATSGIASFGGLSYSLSGAVYFGASASGLNSACTSAVQISPAAATRLVVTQGDGQSATAGALLPLALTVQATDAFGNSVSGATVSFVVSAGGGQVSATSSATDADGQASTQLTLGSVPGSNSVIASIGSGVSASFTEVGTARPAASVLLSGSSVLTAGACSAAYTIQLLDSDRSATVALADLAVTLSGNGNGLFYTDASCAASSSTSTLSIAQGTGSTTVYFADRSAESLTWVAQASGLANSSSLPVSVSAAGAAALAFNVQPSASVIAGQVMAQQPILGASDSFGNSVSAFASAVTLKAFSDPACASPALGNLSASSNPVSATGGQAGFAGVAYDGPGLIYLQASADGLASACSQPVAVSSAMLLAAGTAHTCALNNGGVKCWGFNNAGSLGNGNNVNASTPQQVVGLSSGVITLGAGGQHSCAALATGVVCWGLNSSGQLGTGGTANSNVPSVVSGIAGGVTQLVGGDSHTCALLNGAVQCWGDNTYGQLGNGTNGSSSLPVAVQGLPGAVQSIAAASATTCAVLASGSAYCWGYNDFGQLGNGTTQDSNLPVAVQGLSTVTSIAPGLENTCALVSGGVYCWGHNSFGQLGNGNFGDSMTPVSVAGLGAAVTKLLSGGQNFSCAILAGGAVKCWGQNSRGQLGDNRVSGSQSSTPVQVFGLTSGYQVLHAGYIHGCASDGTHIKCWGWGSSGQLGNGASVQSSVPVQVVGY